MRYPVAIELGDETTAFGVVIPDLPGCFSADDTLEGALAASSEAISVWIEATLDVGHSVPKPSPIADIRKLPEYSGWAFAMVAKAMPRLRAVN